ncbi:hypothetical protein B566_EDAN014100, partial [Ephemera danica]
MKSVVLVLILVSVISAVPNVDLEQGSLRGTTMWSRKGRVFYAFQGIPYAAPPIGSLRFKPPGEAPKWSGEFDARTEGNSCLQIHILLTGKFIGDEDCLYLNVYTPKLENEGSPLSVMVYIHGGGFIMHSGGNEFYGPHFLLDRDIVLVTINYRLGALGFLSLGTKETPGNYGLKDQVAALRWVQKNIAKFGGNPNSVTIFGQSAGAASVHYLMLSPLAKGLFHRAILQSGSAYNPWALTRHAPRHANELARALGCSSQDPLKCLQTADAHQLPLGTSESFLSEDPRTMLARGNISNVPIIAGLNTHEGVIHLFSKEFIHSLDGGILSLSDPRVVIDQGPLRGTTLRSRAGKDIFTFQGIPYAAAPNPQAPPAWNEERLVNVEANKCLQRHVIFEITEGSEDCLYLNVYTPQLERKGAGLSVMVWIHGGGFTAGSGDSDLYGPQHLLDHNVVLVTFNYRLGALGFLSLGSKEAPGNYGLKDQVAALRWVQKNIEKFGGNPNSVTIFGQSAGGASVHYLMSSPQAQGLFHRAIAQSGSALNGWALDPEAGRLGLGAAAVLKCRQKTIPDVLVCLRKIDASMFLDVAKMMKSRYKKDLVFVPTIEPPDTEDPFLNEEPRDLLARGDMYSDMEGVLGVDEMVRQVAALRRSPIFYYQFSYDGGLNLFKSVLNIKRP